MPSWQIHNHRYIFSKGGDSDVGLHVKVKAEYSALYNKNDMCSVSSVFDDRVIALLTDL